MNGRSKPDPPDRLRRRVRGAIFGREAVLKLSWFAITGGRLANPFDFFRKDHGKTILDGK